MRGRSVDWKNKRKKLKSVLKNSNINFLLKSWVNSLISFMLTEIEKFVKKKIFEIYCLRFNYYYIV